LAAGGAGEDLDAFGRVRARGRSRSPADREPVVRERGVVERYGVLDGDVLRRAPAPIERDGPPLRDGSAGLGGGREDRRLEPQRAVAGRIVRLQEVALGVAASRLRIEAYGVPVRALAHHASPRAPPASASSSAIASSTAVGSARLASPRI